MAAEKKFSGKDIVHALLDGEQGVGKELSRAQRSQLEALEKETDEAIFWRDLFSFGGQLESVEHLDAAGAIYAAIVSSSPPSPTKGSLQQAAQSRLDAIQGKGAFGPRFEFLLKRFTKDASDPKMILPMLAGSAVYGIVRSATLSRLAATAEGGLFTRGIGARFAASSVGFVAEVPVFALSARAMRQASGEIKPGQETSVAHDLAGAAITLGLLKTFSFLGQKGFQGLHGIQANGAAARFQGGMRASQFAFNQGSMFVGLMTAHKLEEKIGLRPHLDGATTITDTLASMVSLGVGAHLGHKMLGKGYARWNQELNLQTQAAEQSLPQPRRASSWIRSPLLAPMWMAMATGSLGGGGGSKPPRRIPSSIKSAEPIKALQAELGEKLGEFFREEPESAKPYHSHLKYLASKRADTKVFELLKARFERDPDDALDLIEAWRNALVSLRYQDPRTLHALAVELEGQASELLLPTFHLIELNQRSEGKRRILPNRIFAAARFLGGPFPTDEAQRASPDFRPELRFMPFRPTADAIKFKPLQDLWERLASGKIPNWTAAVEGLEKMGLWPEEVRRYFLVNLGNGLQELRGDPGKKGASDEFNVRLAQHIYLWGYFSEISKIDIWRPLEVLNSISWTLGDGRVADAFKKFRTLSESAHRERGEFWDAWQALLWANMPEDKGEEGSWGVVPRFDLSWQKTIQQDFDLAARWIPKKLAARLVTDRRYLAELAENEGVAGTAALDMLALQDLSYEGEYLSLFSNFVIRSQEFLELRAPHQYLHYFAEFSQIPAITGERDIPWESFQLGRGMAPEEARVFRALVQELQETQRKSTPPPPALMDLSIPHELQGFPQKLDHPAEVKERVTANNELLLDQNQLFLRFCSEAPGSPTTKRFTRIFLESLRRLPVRPGIQPPFFRSDLYFNVLRRAGIAKDAAPDFLPYLRSDLEELKMDRGDHRGLYLGRWVYRLEQMNHPQMERALQLILEEALSSPPGNRANPFHRTPETLILETLDTLWSPNVARIFTEKSQNPDLRRQAEKVAGIVERYRQSKGVMPGAEVMGRVSRLFYNNLDSIRLDEASAEKLVLPKSAGTGGTTALNPGPAGEQAAASTALAKVFTSGELQLANIEANPETGLLEAHLGGGVRMALWHAAAPVRAIDADLARSDWSQRQEGGLHEMYSEMKSLDKEQAKIDITALVPSSAADSREIQKNLDIAREADSLKMMMKAAMGEDPEEALMHRLGEAMSLRQGLDMMEMSLRSLHRDSKVRINSIKDLGDYAPQVTSSDLVMISLADRAPRLLSELKGVTMPFRLHVSGIEWANDDYDPGMHRNGLFPIDPYQYGGFTGRSLGTEHTHFNSWVKDLLQSALKTRLSDQGLFRTLWEHHPESGMAGLKMLKDRGLTSRLLNKDLRDLDFSGTLPASQAARLIGLLEKIPSCLAQDAAARIYFKPFAAGVLFLNAEGKPLEYVGYHPHLQRTGFQEIHYKTEGDHSDQNLMAQQFLGERLMGKFLDVAVDQSGGELSVLEEMMMNFTSKYRVSLPLAFRIAELPEEGAIPKPLSYDETAANRSLKMGLQEVGEIDRVFSLLPEPLLERIRRGTEAGGGLRQIRKDIGEAVNFVDWTRRGNKLGFYQPEDQSITILHMHQVPFHHLDEVGRQIWSDTVLHELAEALYESLTPRERQSFASIYPWRTGVADEHAARIPPELLVTLGEGSLQELGLTPDLSEKEISRHLLTHYSSSNPRDLFCEAFMAYVAHGPEFRAKAENSHHLKKMYEALRERFFLSKDGIVEYSVPATASLVEIEGQIRRWRLEVTKQRQDLELAENHEWAKTHVFTDWIQSPEADREAEQRREAEREAREMSEGGGFLGSYFAMLRLDEAEGKRGPSKSERDKSDKLEDEILTSLEEVFRDEIFNHPNIKVGTLADQVWHRLSKGRRAKALQAIEEKIRKVEERYGEEALIENDAEEILDFIIDTAISKMTEGSPLQAAYANALGRHLLPGQFLAKDIEALEEIFLAGKTSQIRRIRVAYDFLKGKEAWSLNPEQSAEIAAEIAAAKTSVGKELEADPLSHLIQDLEKGETDLYEIAEHCNLEVGKVDAFAERFLPGEKYQVLQKRSEPKLLLHQLEISLAVQGRLEAQFRELFPAEALPEELRQGMERNQSAIAALQRGDAGSLEMARRVLGNSGYRSQVEELSRRLFEETEVRRDRERSRIP